MDAVHRIEKNQQIHQRVIAEVTKKRKLFFADTVSPATMVAPNSGFPFQMQHYLGKAPALHPFVQMQDAYHFANQTPTGNEALPFLVCKGLLNS